MMQNVFNPEHFVNHGGTETKNRSCAIGEGIHNCLILKDSVLLFITDVLEELDVLHSLVLFFQRIWEKKKKKCFISKSLRCALIEWQMNLLII